MYIVGWSDMKTLNKRRAMTKLWALIGFGEEVW
jgi:hypothetical protein